MVNKNFNSYNKAVTNPCYQCKERIVGCHSTCEKYKNFVEENKRKKDLIIKSRIADDAILRFNKGKHAKLQQKFRENYRKERHTR